MPRRAAILVLLAFVLGAINTVAIAWTIAWEPLDCGFEIPFESQYELFVESADCYFQGQFQAEVGHAIYSISRHAKSDLTPSMRNQYAINDVPRLSLGDLPKWVVLPTPAPCVYKTSNAYGWPCLALRSVHTQLSYPLSPGRSLHKEEVEECWRRPYPDDFTSPTLPLGIIWPGVLINTLLFAAAWFVALVLGQRTYRSVSIAVRNRRALRRGICPTCSYDLLGDFASGCPECGWNRAAAAQPPN